MNFNKSLPLLFSLGFMFSLSSFATNNLSEEEKIMQKELNKISQKQDDLVVEKLENGAEMLDLKGRFQMLSKATKGKSSTHYHCGDPKKHTHKKTKAEVE